MPISAGWTLSVHPHIGIVDSTVSAVSATQFHKELTEPRLRKASGILKSRQKDFGRVFNVVVKK